MLFRKPLPLKIWVSLFVVLIAAIPITYRLLHRPANPPRTLTELTALLSQDTPSLHVVPVREIDLELGIYICTSPKSRKQLINTLLRNPKVGSKWQGVVFCDRIGNNSSAYYLAEDLQTWGEYGMRIGPFLFFGDPELLQRIRKLMAASTIDP